MNTKHIIIITALILLAAFAAVSAQNIKIGPDGYGRGRLPNGITILMNSDKTTSLTAVRIIIGGGLTTENPGINGISNLMIKMLLKGNDRMSAAQITERLDFLGAQVSAEAFRDYSTITIVCLSKNLPEVLTIINRCMMAPTFPDDELVKLKIEVTGAIKTENDNQTTASANLFWKTLYGDNAYGLPVLGMNESIQAIDTGKLREHFKRYVGGNNIIISAASDLSPEQISLLLNDFSALPAQATLPSIPVLKPQLSKEGFIQYDRNQSFIFMGYPLPHLNQKEILALGILNEIMGANVGSRLWDLRQKEQLAYSVYSQYTLDKYDALFRAAIGTDTAKVKTALASLIREFKTLYDSGITAAELADAKVNIKNNLIFRIDSKIGRASNMAGNEYIGYGYKMISELMAAIDKVTVDDVDGFIKARLNPDGLYTSIVGKK